MAEGQTVLLTNALHPDGQRMLDEAGVRSVLAPDVAADTLRRLALEVDGIIVRAQLPADICDHAPRLKGIVRHGVGLDFIPVEAATAAGVPVANLPGCNTQAVAEYVIAQLLNLRRPLLAVDAKLRSDGWDKARALPLGGGAKAASASNVDEVLARAEGCWVRKRMPAAGFSELGGTVLGILGVGNVGARIARIAQAIGMTVIGVCRDPSEVPAGVEAVSMDELFARADALVLSCALTPETRGIVNAARIATMKPGAVVINASRGPVIDTAALVSALHEGRIAGAALDVYDQHPIEPGHPLFDCPNLLMTPHIAAITTTSMRAMSVGAVGEMLRILSGREPEHLVNSDYRKNRGQP
jgi:D-3-phosphoglycerate dehydrogenase